MSSFRVDSIDHVELFVPDRHEAARWYQQALGLAVIPEYEFWAVDSGPLVIATADGHSKLALFEGAATDPKVELQGFRRVAFRVDAAGFLEFVKTAGRRDLRDVEGNALTTLEVIDHQASLSVYFRDPWGHALEVTTYDADACRAR